MKLLRNKAVLFAVLGAVVIVGGWYAVLWGPRSSSYAKAEKDVAAMTSQAGQLQAQVSRLRAEALQAPVRQAQLAKLQSAIPGDPQLAQFILALDNAATQAGVDLETIAPAPPTASTGGAGVSSSGTAGPPPPAVKLSLSLKGTYAQILDFIDRVDSLPRLVVIDSVAVNGGGTGNQLSVTLAGRMFVGHLPGAGAASTSVADGPTSVTAAPTTPASAAPSPTPPAAAAPAAGPAPAPTAAPAPASSPVPAAKPALTSANAAIPGAGS
ncbi:MAG TPA: hypothetical protein VFH70_04780 [Acidimicrobiales bacterium]|nr:hypothetical protein [Acidimicrobiales bacterium]